MFEGLFRPMHLILILIIFGPGRLPEIGAGLGKSIRSFKKAMSDPEEEKKDEIKAAEKTDEKKN